MKKLIYMIIIEVLINMLCLQSAFAADLSVKASVNKNTAKVKISGNIFSGSGSLITVVVINPYGGLDYIDQVASKDEGHYSFLYELDENVEGTYIARVGGAEVDGTRTTTFTYTPKEKDKKDDEEVGKGKAHETKSLLLKDSAK